jgi:D-serine deaminase-like pyridoxal phosphate-dependent protein
VHVDELQTPALLVDRGAFDRNVATMSSALPGDRLRPHVKAFKSTALARRLADAGHRTFCAATPREVIGMAEAGLGDDLLLANECVDAARLRALAEASDARGARITVAVDSDATVDAAAAAGLREVLVDVDVGLPRCGCRPEDAGRVADRARAAGLEVRGVMGYEGHLMVVEDRAERAAGVEQSMHRLLDAHELVGGGVVSGGGTGTFDTNTWCTEIQAGSYVLMDTAYLALGLPFELALTVLATVVSVNDRWAVADVGLKSLGMDHGNPSLPGTSVWFCSDEHTTFAPDRSVAVGDRVRVEPAHVDPTVALHEQMYVVDGDEVVDVWPVDLRGW